MRTFCGSVYIFSDCFLGIWDFWFWETILGHFGPCIIYIIRAVVPRDDVAAYISNQDDDDVDSMNGLPTTICMSSPSASHEKSLSDEIVAGIK